MSDDDNLPGIYEQQTMVALSIYSFMDNLFSAIRNSENDPTPDTTQQSLSTEHPDIKPGGYADEVFLYLSDKDKEDYECSICFNILKNAHQCKNDHKFCFGCIVVWSKQSGQSSDLCPVCRTEGLYAKNDVLNDKLGKKRVKCLEKNCNWRGCLLSLESHEHRKYELREIYTEGDLLPSLPSKSTATEDKPLETKPLQKLSDITPVGLSGRITSNEVIQSNDTTVVSITADIAMNVGAVAAATASPVSSETVASTSSRILNRRESSTATRLQTNNTAARASTTSLSSNSQTNVNRNLSRNTQQNSASSSVPSSSTTTTITGNRNTRQNVATNEPTTTSSTSATAPVTTPHPPSGPRPRNVRPVIRARTNTGNAPSGADEPNDIGQTPLVPHPPPPLETVSTTTNTPTTTTTVLNTSSSVPPHHVSSIRTSSLTSTQQPEPSAQPLQYRRLVTRPRQQPNTMARRLNQSREQLAVLMTLLTIELDERRRAVEQYQIESQDREQRRLQQLVEVQSLNRRLHQVASNLGRIVDNRNSPSHRPGLGPPFNGIDSDEESDS